MLPAGPKTGRIQLLSAGRKKCVNAIAHDAACFLKQELTSTRWWTRHHLGAGISKQLSLNWLSVLLISQSAGTKMTSSKKAFEPGVIQHMIQPRSRADITDTDWMHVSSVIFRLNHQCTPILLLLLWRRLCVKTQDIGRCEMLADPCVFYGWSMLTQRA